MHPYSYHFQTVKWKNINPIKWPEAVKRKRRKRKQSNMAAKGLTEVKVLYIVHTDNCYGICLAY
jgi:hypothetical protein